MKIFEHKTIWFEEERIMIIFGIKQRYDLLHLHRDTEINSARQCANLILYSSLTNDSKLFPTKDVFSDLIEHKPELNKILYNPEITRNHIELSEEDVVQFQLMLS
jgi:hypothetical protein